MFSISRVNGLEEDVEDEEGVLAVTGQTLELSMKPFQIISVKITINA